MQYRSGTNHIQLDTIPIFLVSGVHVELEVDSEPIPGARLLQFSAPSKTQLSSPAKISMPAFKPQVVAILAPEFFNEGIGLAQPTFWSRTSVGRRLDLTQTSIVLTTFKTNQLVQVSSSPPPSVAY